MMRNILIAKYVTNMIGVFSLVVTELNGAIGINEVKGFAHVSIVAVGPKPKNRFKLPGKKEIELLQDKLGDEETEGPRVNRSDHAGIPIPLPPLVGTTPPATLYLRSTGAKAAEPEWSRLRVGFNSSTAISKVPSGEVLPIYRRHQKGDLRYERYLKLPEMSSGSQMMVFLLPGEKGRRPWLKQPRVSVLDLRSQRLLEKNMLLRNYASRSVAVAIGNGKPVILEPGQRRSRKLDNDAGFQRISAMAGSKKKEILLNTTVRVTDESLTVLVFYDANPKTNAGKSVGVFRAAVKRLPPEVLNKPRE